MGLTLLLCSYQSAPEDDDDDATLRTVRQLNVQRWEARKYARGIIFHVNGMRDKLHVKSLEASLATLRSREAIRAGFGRLKQGNQSEPQIACFFSHRTENPILCLDISPTYLQNHSDEATLLQVERANRLNSQGTVYCRAVFARWYHGCGAAPKGPKGGSREISGIGSAFPIPHLRAL